MVDPKKFFKAKRTFFFSFNINFIEQHILFSAIFQKLFYILTNSLGKSRCAGGSHLSHETMDLDAGLS